MLTHVLGPCFKNKYLQLINATSEKDPCHQRRPYLNSTGTMTNLNSDVYFNRQ